MPERTVKHGSLSYPCDLEIVGIENSGDPTFRLKYCGRIYELPGMCVKYLDIKIRGEVISEIGTKVDLHLGKKEIRFAVHGEPTMIRFNKSDLKNAIRRLNKGASRV